MAAAAAAGAAAWDGDLVPTGMQASVAPGGRIVHGKAFPLMLSPADQGGVSREDLPSVIAKHRHSVLRLILEHGAVALRGFGLASPEDFAASYDGLHMTHMPYVGGAAVRHNVVGDRIFTANESPPSEPIPFHHELAQTPQPPSHIFFFCETAPAKGGETPLIRSDEVMAHLTATWPQLARDLETRGVRYVRILPDQDDPSSAIGRSWRSTYQTESREAAEAAMRQQGTSWEWLANGCLRTTTAVVPAVRHDPRTGRKVFFNSVVAAFTGWVDSRNDPTKAVVFGDGGAVPSEDLTALAHWMHSNRVSMPWQPGDLMMVDNTNTMHSRSPFEGTRRVLAAIGRGVDTAPPCQVGLEPVLAATSPVGAAGEQGGEALAARTPRVALPSGDGLPAVGLRAARGVGEEAVLAAIRAGCRHIDTAAVDGNEEAVGRGLRRAMEEGTVSRQELFVTGKLWSTHHAPEHVPVALQATLQKLGLAYLDLFLVHYPVAIAHRAAADGWSTDPTAAEPAMRLADIPMHATWAAMERLVEGGLVRSIGVGHMGAASLRDLQAGAKIAPAALQAEFHPRLVQTALRDYCKTTGVVFIGVDPGGALAPAFDPALRTRFALAEGVALVAEAPALAAAVARTELLGEERSDLAAAASEPAVRCLDVTAEWRRLGVALPLYA